MLKELKNLVAFLTILPVGMTSDCLIDAANYMYLFPAVGAFIGLLAGLLALILTYVFPSFIIGILTCGFILLLTGLHHTDGLLDFGDGVMYQGPPEKKIEIMRDQQTGAGGLVLGLITILTTAFCIAQLSLSVIFQSLVVSEVSAKLAMVILAWCGKSAHRGMNTSFVNAMHN
jgi:adenosylcobinamide-GDP ribazoletransferase